MTSIKGNKPLTDEELEVLVRFVELFGGRALDIVKAPAGNRSLRKGFKKINR